MDRFDDNTTASTRARLGRRIASRDLPAQPASGNTPFKYSIDAVVRAQAVMNRTSVTVAEAQALCDRVADLRETMRVCRSVHQWRPLAGGADGGETVRSIRARIRRLIASGELPATPPSGITASPSSGEHRCIACGSKLTPAEPEFEVIAKATYRLHARCIELWASVSQRG